MRLLAAEFDGVEKLRAQAEAVVAVEPNCTCGCPSITPRVDRAKGPASTGRSLIRAELQELHRADGIERTVLFFRDSDGYLGNLECVYYDGPIGEWPDPASCAVMLRSEDGYLVGVVLPSGARVQPVETGDAWVSFEADDLGGFHAATWSGWRETYNADGALTSRSFTK